MRSALFALSVFALLATTALGAASVTRGVPKELLEKYIGDTFKCLDGAGPELPASYINDDYCDCADGSDEPGTAACASGQFYCKNAGFEGELIPSSRVGDGVCDCCDGSDEAGGEVECRNSCDRLKEAALAKKSEMEEVFRLGARERALWLEEAKIEVAHKARMKDIYAGKLKRVERRAEELEESKQHWEEIEKRAKASGVSVEEMEKTVEAEKAAGEEGEGAADEGADGEAAVEEQAPKKRKRPSFNLVPDEEPEELLESALFSPLEEAWYRSKRFVGRVWNSVVRFMTSIPMLTASELSKIRKQAKDAKEELETLKKNMKTVDEFLEKDFGPDQLFFKMFDKCYKSDVSGYTYEMCAFKQITQKSGSVTSVGKWEGWIGDDYKQMKYANGAKCWQGPKRETTVNLVCGADNEIKSVEEVAKCEYVMEFATPALCTAEAAAEYGIDLDAGDSDDGLAAVDLGSINAEIPV